MKKRILSIFLAALMVISLLPVTAFAAATTEVADFAALKSACTVSGGTHKLNGDVKFKANIEIDSDFKLDLNNCVLNLNGHILIVPSGKKFELYDTSGTKTRYYNKDATTGLWTLAPDQTIATDYTTTGGVITGGDFNYAAVDVSGTFIMYGGNISGNKGRAKGSVSVETTGTFTMEDGNISGNATTGNGAQAGGSGVHVGGGMFTMKKGTISNNTAVGTGGNSGVYVDSGTVVLGGTAKITGNKSGTGEGETTKNLCLWDGAKITLGTGADVPAAGMSVGVTMYAPGPFTVPASGAEEAQSYFFADDSENNEFGYDDNSTPVDKTDDFLKLTKRHAITNGTKSADAGTNHGYITVNEKATVGTTVTVTVTPNEGYTLKSLIWYPTTTPSNTHDITAEKSFTMYDFPITVRAEFESTLPNIKVTKVSGVEDPVSGTAMSETQFYNIETNNFAGTPSLTLQWKNGETWDGTAPTGVTLTVDGKLTTTAAAPEGSYYFRITNGLADGAEGFVSSGQTMLNVSPAAEKVATPTANPAAGTYTTGQSVTLSTTTDGASIYYTTDDTTPTTSSTEYTGAIAVNATTTIKAIAVKADWTDSDMLTATYTISNGPSDSGDSEPTYMIALETAKNGTFTVSKKSAYAGQTVTITVAPDKGFTLETLTVLDRSGREVKVKSLGNNKYSFAMPASKVTVSVSFMEDNTMLNFFVDVKAEDYFYDAVLWAAENGITKGTDDVHFSPNAPVTRAQVVTFLWRAAGKPVVNYAMNMSDVKSGEYYSEAVRWALAEGITKGTSDTTFSPDAVCTRGQIVTFLARFAGVEDADTASVFSDVKTTDYFAAAVKWAKDNKVTEGTSATTFSPNTDCTRAQVVTFLYRWMVK